MTEEKIPAKKKIKAVEVDPANVVEATDDIIAAIHASGDESAGLLGSENNNLKIRGVISTQCPTLDLAIGRGGIPLGRLTILHGGEACGKTSSALHLVAEVQRLGGIALYMDKEYKLDPDYAEAIGVDTKKLIISQPNHLESAFDIQSKVIERAAKWRVKNKKRVPILIVLDSMNAAITKAQFEGDSEQKHMAAQARCYSEQLPRLIPQASKEDVALCWISQIRKKMNIQFGDGDEIAGGQAPRFYASLIINYKRVGTLKSGQDKIGSNVVAECKKNQISSPFKKAKFDIRWGEGIDAEGALLEIALEKGVIARRGNTFYFGEVKLGITAEKVSSALKKAPKYAAKIAAASEVPWRSSGLTEGV